MLAIVLVDQPTIFAMIGKGTLAATARETNEWLFLPNPSKR
jgi:hypothetical protein